MCIIHFLLNSRIGSEGHFWNFWNICKNLILTSHDFGYIWSSLSTQQIFVDIATLHSLQK